MNLFGIKIGLLFAVKPHQFNVKSLNIGQKVNKYDLTAFSHFIAVGNSMSNAFSSLVRFKV